MLSRLTIKNFAIIEDIEVNFYEGLNVLLGETGAGKSILIDALSLLQGNRSSLDKIRNGETKAFIEGEFVIKDESLIKTINEEYDDLISEDTIVVSRSLDINGKSTVKINFHTVPLQVVKNIMGQILDIHSQHKDQSFFDEDKQIEYLDIFINKSNKINKNKIDIEIFDEYKDKFLEFKQAQKELKKMNEDYYSLEDKEILTYQYNELEKADVKENELEDIEEELKRLNNFEKLQEIISSFKTNYEEASSNLYNCKKSLEKINDDAFDEDKEKFLSFYYELEDCYESLNEKYSSFEDNIYHIDELQKRRSELKSLCRKYGGSSSSLIAKFKEIKDQLNLIENFDYMISLQEKKISSIKSELEKIASSISSIRHEFALKLKEKMNKELHDLLLENSEFDVSIEQSDFNDYGFDQVRFLIKANAGGKFLSLKSSASLGETSRINLALKSLFNELQPVGTIIFDEIDTGISGRVGVATSNKLKKISSSSQTLIISHLPQVACIGSHHYFVKKVVEEGVTKSRIHEMDDKELIEEIAHMLSGDNITEESLKASEKLIDSMK